MDTFSHERHRELSCIVCHTTTRTEGALNFERPRGCLICHHQDVRRQAASGRLECGRCHQPDELERPYEAHVRIAVQDGPPRERTAAFSHERHGEIRCTECHVTPVTLAPAPPVATCQSCHDQHHAPARNCAECHTTETLRAAHEPPERSHQRCDACHADATVARLVPDRSFCLTCHQRQVDHYPARECTICHFLASPEDYRPRLTRRSDG